MGKAAGQGDRAGAQVYLDLGVKNGHPISHSGPQKKWGLISQTLKWEKGSLTKEKNRELDSWKGDIGYMGMCPKSFKTENITLIHTRKIIPMETTEFSSRIGRLHSLRMIRFAKGSGKTGTSTTL